MASYLNFKLSKEFYFLVSPDIEEGLDVAEFEQSCITGQIQGSFSEGEFIKLNF